MLWISLRLCAGGRPSHGRVIDMAGDSVLAVFKTATGAVTAALAIQNELNPQMDAATESRRMRFRIGVHLGDVIEKADGSVYGDGVNIAAWLEGLAEPGGVTVSESIHTAVRSKVSASFDDQGEQAVKNIAHKVLAYRFRLGGARGEVPIAKPAIPVTEIDLSLSNDRNTGLRPPQLIWRKLISNRD